MGVKYLSNCSFIFCFRCAKLQNYKVLSEISSETYNGQHMRKLCMLASNVELNVPVYLHGSDRDTVRLIDRDFKVYDEFVNETEENGLIEEAQNHLKRLRYQYDHWDDAIHGYRETEQKHWTEKNQLILEKVRELAFPPDASHLQHVHILDLEKMGYIKPHIDSVRFCGDTIAGISLLSSCVMRLVHEENKNCWVDVLLKQRSLYVMKGTARYKYTHEVLDEKNSKFRDMVIPRDRRISIICRSEPNNEKSENENLETKSTNKGQQ